MSKLIVYDSTLSIYYIKNYHIFPEINTFLTIYNIQDR
jgi:hypothetical protein